MLAVVEGILCKNSIAAVTGLPDIVCTLTGICFCLLGLTIGEFMAAKITKDPLTGKRQYTSKFWLGLFLGFLYCGIQYFLASKSGGLHASAEIAETVNTMTIVVTAISIIEIVFGFLFMKTALQMLTLGINTLHRKTVNKKKMHLRDAQMKVGSDRFSITRHITTLTVHISHVQKKQS